MTHCYLCGKPSDRESGQFIRISVCGDCRRNLQTNSIEMHSRPVPSRATNKNKLLTRPFQFMDDAETNCPEDEK